MLAMSALSLQALSGGRFLLGLGVSGPQIMEGWHGVRFAAPLRATRETVEIVRAIAAGHRLDYQGGAYQIPLPGGAGRPIRSMVAPAPVPIYLAALGPRNLELTGELADGWIGNAFIPESASAFVDHLQAGASRAGRSLDGLDLLIPVSLEITDDVAEAAARHAAGYAFTIGAMGSATQNFYNAAFSRQGFAEDVQAVQQLWLAGKREEAAARVPRDIGFKTNLIGPPEIIRDRLRLYRAAGVTTLQVKSAGQGRATLDAIAALIDLVDEVNREGQPRRD
jgi:F420-dependent oxidoreductase-like protein